MVLGEMVYKASVVNVCERGERIKGLEEELPVLEKDDIMSVLENSILSIP
jgi:hypothetical protein